MIGRAPGTKVAKIIRAIDHFNGMDGRPGGRRFDNTTTYRTERIVQDGDYILSVGRLVNPSERLDRFVTLSWDFTADGRLSGVDFHSGGSEALSLLTAEPSTAGAAVNV